MGVRMSMKHGLPFFGMVMVQFAQVGLLIATKEAMAIGMSNLSILFYANTLAALILFPFNFIFYRSERPPITFAVLCSVFLFGLIGFLANFFGNIGLKYASSTLATAMFNLIPAFTFVLAIIFRMEEVDWKSSFGIAKTAGTLVSITGAFIVTLYKGIPIFVPHSSSAHLLLFSRWSNSILGGLLLALDSFLCPVMMIFQVWILKKYPVQLILVFYYFLFGAIQSAVVSLCVERDLMAWSLKPIMRLIYILYIGVFGSAFGFGVAAWCLHKTGPLFVSMFLPLSIVISLAIGVIFLGETIYIGSLVGAAVIFIGFYAMMWGKAKEEQKGEDEGSGARILEPSSLNVPLLQNNIEETQKLLTVI